MLKGMKLEVINCHEKDSLSVQINKERTRFVLNLNNEETHWPSWRSKKLFSYFPEWQRLDNPNRIAVAATDTSALIIARCWRNPIRFVDDETKAVYMSLIMACVSHDMIAERTARFKDGKKALGEIKDWHHPGTVKEMTAHGKLVPSHKLQLHPEFTLADYQQVALINSMNTESYALFMEQGTGKTPTVIARIDNEALNYDGENGIYKCLIICPNNVRTNWVSEFKKFSTVKGRVAVVRGSKFERFQTVLEAVMGNGDNTDDKYVAIIVGWDSLSRTEILETIQWDLAVGDESHYIKSSSTNRCKAAFKLRVKTKQRMALTGTPITNTPADLWSQMEFLGKGISGFMREKNFRNFYMAYVDQYASGHQKFAGIQNVELMKERLARYAFIVKKNEVLQDLPDKVYDQIEVEMTPEQTDAYAKLKQELVYQIESQLDKADANDTLIINNILTQMLKLAQITSGHLNFPPEFNDAGDMIKPGSTHRFDPNPKIEAIVELLKEKDKYDKTIIWCAFVQDIKSLASRLRLEGIDCVTFYGATSENDREKAVYDFNCNPECKVFIGNAGAGGTGINLLGYDHRNESGNPDALKTNANHVIYMSQDWSAVKRSQSEDRCHRRGTREPVRITDLTVPGTIDSVIRARVLDKRQMAASVQDLRVIFKDILEGKEIM